MYWYGELILEKLNDYGWTRDYLAKRVGTTPVTIGRYITGERHPDFRMAIKISDALSLPIGVMANRVRKDMEEESHEDNRTVSKDREHTDAG